jgi:hypothetical protein
LNVLGRDCLLKCRGKRREEVFLRNVCGAGLYLKLDLFSVRLFKRTKAPDIERLKDVRRMSRHTECNDVIVLAILLEFDGVVTFMPIQH